MTIRWRPSVAVALGVCACLANARQKPPDSNNHLITLDVVVAEKSGTPLLSLQEQDFTLLDNRQPQKIVSFNGPKAVPASGLPEEVILLIDEVNTSFRAVASERIEIESFLKRNGGQLPCPVSLIFFTDAGASMGSVPSKNGQDLIAQMHGNRAPLRAIGRSQGIYGANDRLELSLRTLGQLAAYEQPRPGRKLVVWISPGWPLLSGPREQLSEKNEQAIFRSIVATSGALRDARITLYSVDPLGTSDTGGLRTSYWQSFLKGVKKAQQAQIGNLALQVLADQSGGLVLNSSNDVAGEIAKCLADANTFYELSFKGLPGDGPDDYHSIEVKVNTAKVTARTRTGYYAQPGQAPAH